jgi:TPR repeat protein
MDVLKLYSDQKLTDCTINNVPFHCAVLYCSDIDYFKGYESFTNGKKEILIKYNEKLYSEETIKLLKKWIYKIRIDKADIRDLDREIIYEIYDISKYLEITLFGFMDYYIRDRDDSLEIFRNINIFKYCLCSDDEDETIFDYSSMYDSILKVDIEYINRLGTCKNDNAIKAYYLINKDDGKQDDGKRDANRNMAFDILQKDYINNNFYSTHLLAVCYYYGYGCEIDGERAFELFRKNWEINNYAPSGNFLAIMYLHGTYCKYNIERFTSIAIFNYKKNCNYYAGMLLIENCDKKKERYYYYSLCRELYILYKNEIAKNKLIECYNGGIGCDKSDKKISQLENDTYI